MPSWPAAASSPMPATILIDALLWTTGQVAHEVGAVQSQCGPGIDLVTAAAIRLADGTPVTLAISGISPGTLFALDYFGELGRLRATDQTLEEERFGHTAARGSPCLLASQTIDGNFVAALANGTPLVLSSRSGSRHRATPRSHRAVRHNRTGRSTHLSR